jgi:hypothetical protein
MVKVGDQKAVLVTMLFKNGTKGEPKSGFGSLSEIKNEVEGIKRRF